MGCRSSVQLLPRLLRGLRHTCETVLLAQERPAATPTIKGIKTLPLHTLRFPRTAHKSPTHHQQTPSQLHKLVIQSPRNNFT